MSDSGGSVGDARWRVFISHTSELRSFPKAMSYVAAVERAVSAAGHVVVDMADFAAAGQPPARVCAEKVRGCDVYVGVLGTRYGSPVRDQPEVSYTELEFKTATDAGKDRLVFLLDTATADVGIPPSELIDREFGARQDAFRRRVRDSGLLTQSFANPAELGQLVERALRDLARTRQAVFGSVPGGALAGRRVPPFIVPPIPAHCERREELLTRARDALLATSTNDAARTVGLVGMGGGGKSVLARALARDEQVRRAFPQGIVWLELGLSPNLLVRHAQLAEQFGDPRPAAADLQQALARLNGTLAGAACLIVLDNVWRREHLQAFELLEPKSALLVTTRYKDVLGGFATVPVGPLPEKQSRRLLAAWAGAGEDRLPSEAEEVAQKCGGLPLALAIAGGMVADRDHSWHYVCERLRRADLDKLEIQFRDYGYENLLLVLDASVSDLTPLQRARYLELAVFDGHGNVPVEVVQRLWRQAGLEDLDAEDLISRLARRSLLQREALTLTLHDLQYLYARRTLGVRRLRGLHARLADTILQAWGGLDDELPALCDSPLKDPAGHYGVVHLVSHLNRAGQGRSIHRLMALNSRSGIVPGRPAPKENTWYAAHDRIGEPAAYSGDVALAWDLARKPGARASHPNDPVSSIGLEVRYALVTASIASIAANIPPQLLVALVESGHWAAGQCLAYARQLRATELRAETLTRLVSFLNASSHSVSPAPAGTPSLSEPGPLLAASAREALTAAHAVASLGRRSRILITLAPELPEPYRTAAASEAWKAGCAVPEDFPRAEALATLAAKGKVPQALRAQVLAAARAVDHPGPQARALAALAPHLPAAERAGALKDAQAAILRIHLPQDRAVALAELFFQLPEAERAAAAARARGALREVAPGDARDQALATLAVKAKLPETLQTQVLDDACTVHDPSRRADILTALIPKLPQPSRDEAVNAAWAAANKIRRPETRAAALTALVPHLHEPGRSEALNAVQDAIRAINDGTSRAAALTSLAAQLPQNDRVAALAQALADARAINDPRLRAMAFTVLMAQLPRPNSSGTGSYDRRALNTALADARASGDPNSRAVTQAILAPLISEPAERRSVIHAAAAEAHKVSDPGDRADLLSALAPDLTEPARSTAIDEACVAACAIHDPDLRSAALRGLAFRVPEAVARQARSTAQAMNKALGVSEGFSFTLAHCEPDADERLEILHKMLTAQMMDEAGLPALAPDAEFLGQLPERNRLAVLKEARAFREAIGEVHSRATALGTMTANLSHPRETDWVPDTERAIAEVCSMVAKFRTLGSELPQQLQDQVMGALSAIKNASSWAEGKGGRSYLPGQLHEQGGDWVLREALMGQPEFHDAFTALVFRLSDPAGARAWRDARNAAFGIKDPAARAAALSRLASRAPRGERNTFRGEALTAALAINNPGRQAEILIALAPDLLKKERAAALAQALRSARSVNEDGRRAHMLRAVAEIALTGSVLSWDLHWRAVVEDAAKRGRAALISDLSAISSVISRLGGGLAIEQSIQGLLDVGRWWQ